MRVLSENACTYARLTVFSFYSFVECFVNSVGMDFILRTPTLAPDRKDDLMGIRRGKKSVGHRSIEWRIEKYPTFIRTDGSSPIVITDSNQRAEPYKSFVENVKALRDSIAHYGKHKTAIWRAPIECVERAEHAAKTSIAVAKGFWEACYPGRGPPQYLLQLDDTRLAEMAHQRLGLA